jgi:hypothetical protein
MDQTATKQLRASEEGCPNPLLQLAVVFSSQGQLSKEMKRSTDTKITS